VPVATCRGDSFAGRVGASLMGAIGLAELVAGSPAEYEALAMRLATDRDMLARAKATLARNLPACPLFDTARLVRNIELAYRAMWERWRRGEKPRGFAVGPPAEAPRDG
jgi:predicted O-linked N-acetylglucosamine transferase (SPINDLY family)